MSKHITNYKPKDFAELLNVSVKTLQRWDRDKILVAKRNPTGRRYYTYDQYLEFKGVSNDNEIFRKIIIYYNTIKEKNNIEYFCKENNLVFKK